MSELAPCPFCGGPAGIRRQGTYGKYIGCLDLSCPIMPHRIYDVEADESLYVKAWGERIIPPAPADTDPQGERPKTS